jgi:hypothetical protein
LARGQRGFAGGRKNRYRSRSERGTRVAALIYSLIESAKLAWVEPRGYLGEATRRAIRDPGTVTLPRDLKSPKSGKKLPLYLVAADCEDGRRLTHHLHLDVRGASLYLAIVLDARSREIEMIALASQHPTVVLVRNADAISERTP